ncbi:MAG: 5-formyltetrahydrofolate cyclo-ligase [Clostridia bacterium]|nr:5-formyltetrahydrofolate cyclo-ligase [Clostridia bacterium]
MRETAKVPETEDVREIKRTLRREAKARREGLSDAYLAAAGEAIQRRVLASELYRRAERVFLYVSMPGEPSTDQILERALADGKKVYVPLCKQKIMHAVRIHSREELHPGTMGIPEPEPRPETVEANETDLILVPCVAAGRNGERLGHGAGYYDRFLRKEHKGTVCLCFEALVMQGIPMTQRDIPMAKVVTEEKEYAVSIFSEA